MNSPTLYREERPWGDFVEYTRNTASTVKIINVLPHEALSLQTHTNRDEFWVVLKGQGKITKGEETLPAEAGQTHWIPRGTKHRIEGGDEALSILEISFGNFSDEDIVRLEDKYGRNK